MSLDLTSLKSYAFSCRCLANEKLAGLTIKEVAAQEDSLNAYPHLEKLSPPKSVIILEDIFQAEMLTRAKEAILDGRVFWEHAAAGEATRLKMGPKFFIEPHRLPVTPEFSTEPGGLAPLSLGQRHLWQWSYEVRILAEEAGLDPQVVMERQKVLLIINEAGCEEVCRQIMALNFLGLKTDHFLLMVQPAFRGLLPNGEGHWDYSDSSPRRLHNHGQMVMQKTMDHQIFHLDQNGQENFLSQADYFSLLEETEDLVSYNIEDLGYLSQALDFQSIGMALALGEQGYGMTMEIVPNNPENPVKGGMCAFDPALGRDVMIESFRLKGVAPKDIGHLNKNFNHYPQPGKIFRQLHSEGLYMPITVKDEAVYFQPVQGDLNFLTKTAFLSRLEPVPLSSWKSPQDTPRALDVFAQQDRQKGFLDLLRQMKVLGI